MVIARFIINDELRVMQLPGHRPPERLKIPVRPPLALLASREPVMTPGLHVVELTLAGPSLTGEPAVFDYL